MTAEIKNRFLIPLSWITTEGNKTGSWRFLRPRFENKTAPCSAGCPAGEDIPLIEMLIAQGEFKEAWETILTENPFPAVCGRVCFHPCEGFCNRGSYDEPIAIHTMERFLADTASRYDFRASATDTPSHKERIAIAGGGPSGLSAAWFLSRLGYQCDVYEASPEVGGVLRWGIPAYRLPKDAFLQDLRHLEEKGVGIVTNKRIDEDFLKDKDDAYSAFIVACGHGKGQKMGIPGEDNPLVIEGLDFLKNIREEKSVGCEGTTAVIGGGNTAIDVARSVIRLGGKAVIYYRRRRGDMPAFDEEIRMALEEGVEIFELLSPAEIRRDNNQLLLSLQKMVVSGEESGRARVVPDGKKQETVRVDRVIRAIGAKPQEAWMNPPDNGADVQRLSHSCLVYKKGQKPVVYAGDLTNETKSVTHAIASGKQAAIALDVLFREGFAAVPKKLDLCRIGNGQAHSIEIYTGGRRKERSSHIVEFSEVNTDYFTFTPRIRPPLLLVEERRRSFNEITLKISAGIAIEEAGRCFNCGLCNGCDNCRLFCPDLAVIKNGEIRTINYDYCKGCGICVVECPRNAMSLEEEENT